MKKVSWFVIMSLLIAVILVGCGEKSQQDIITDLENKMSDMAGYKSQATMTLQTGKEPQTYEVEVWHQAESYYRVALNNDNKDQSQIILRNDEGVFVLTPALNKSFRFQSDWPKNSSQVYLYESLVHDILLDPERTFTATEDHYIFTTNTNYQNKNLNTQEVTLNKKDLSPVQVKIMNTDLEVLVQLDFTGFELDPSFNIEEDFDMKRNMTAAQMNDVPAMSEEVEPMMAYFPLYTPEGVSVETSEKVQSENGERYIIKYSGEKSYTLIQEQTQVVPAMVPMNVTTGIPVDLGYTVGVMTEESLMWSYNGVDFVLASTELEQQEMIEIAQSVYGSEEK
ncbi:sporulation protein [Alkalihalobacillus alcalophilus ATCC 27647 = CGMCC 1.3604]|uniref:Sporulation protein n=1 Tax=Alkalihalobacillus alcalophilus ATCC 27647 = CGMCC 1.3604 TaxID=1218173 RepID=A0A094WEP1_ALKAL|nr:outer membrane lipoprotein carrier protein LolA [Alkalihalobacillus alcalophilus]KGA96219.1 sporulation protein [Alkalihalobacillus alcalophilus ATCC 27647 = CGMCC 1.3604]MED1563001.1 outer membrane lipoprotein carrier protein LolA [Alkalihalobacillus alcalophilus]THG92314.1 sporulation protein [Alkalihalobacillus alcalophilus ATCC 27647 = CGMCC 1.3604]